MANKKGFDYLSRADQLAYNNLKSKKEPTVYEKLQLSYYNNKIEYFNSAPPIERQQIVSNRDNISELESVIEYYSDKNNSGEATVEELEDLQVNRKKLERLNDIKKQEELKEQKAREEYDSLKGKLENRDGSVSNRDMSIIKKYEDEHSVLGFLVDSGTKKNIDDAIEAAEALTEEQNKRKERGYSLFDADAEIASIETDFTKQSKDNILTEKDRVVRKEAMFPFPEFNTKGSFSLVKTDENGNLIPLSEKSIETDIDVPKRVTDKKQIEGLINKQNKSNRQVLNKIFENSGLGSSEKQYATWMKCIDRYQLNIVPPNTETSDITLMTRPSLPLNSASLKMDSFFVQFDTDVVDSDAFAIRCLLDKKWARNNITHARKSNLFNPYSPWLTPITNGLLSISGFPDPTLEHRTTEGGYHQEDQTYVKGGTGLYRSQQLQLNFKDRQGGPLMNLFMLWINMMAQLKDGRMMAYLDDINKNIIPYMVGIYHFNLDPTKTYITNWAKCTMCFPLSVPFGAIMNKTEHQRYITSAGEFSIPFMCNYIHYRELNDLAAFNLLTERYYPNVKKAKTLSNNKSDNINGLPYILNDTYGFRLVYKEVK